MDTNAIEQEALHLPLAERAALAHKLLQSLDELTEAETDALWLEESERRASEIDSGRVQLVSSETVALKARALLR